MNRNSQFQKLHFERRFWLNPRIISVVIILAIFSLAWLIIPLNFLFFLMLAPIALMVWAASYGWRHALSILVDWLHRLERL